MKNNFYKISLVISILLLIFFSIIFVYLYKTINNNNQQADASAIALAKESSRRDALRNLDRSIQLIAPDRALLESHFAQSSNIVSFLDSVEQLGLKAGAEASVDSVSTLPDNSGLVIGLTASGSFESLYKFLTLLENSPYELNFLSMDMQKPSVVSTGAKIVNSKWTAVFKIQLLSFTQ